MAAPLQTDTKRHLAIASNSIANAKVVDFAALSKAMVSTQQAIIRQLYKLRQVWPEDTSGPASDSSESASNTARNLIDVTHDDIQALGRALVSVGTAMCYELAELAALWTTSPPLADERWGIVFPDSGLVCLQGDAVAPFSYVQRTLSAGSGKITIANGTGHSGNPTIDIDVAVLEALIDHTTILNIGSNSHAQIDTHIADTTDPHGASVTLTTPTIGDFTNATHDHADAAGGGSLAEAAVNLAGAVMESDYNAQTILQATSDNTPVPLTVGASTIVGRKSTGNIVALTAAETRTILNVEDGSTADQSDGEIKTAYENNADTNEFSDTEQTKLSGIETSADVTDATNVNSAGATMNSDKRVQGVYIQHPGSSIARGFLLTAVPITITRIYGETDTGTVDMNIEWRAEGSYFTSGTEVETTALVADATGEEQTSGFEDATIPAGSLLVLTSSAVSGSPTELIAKIEYTVD